MGVLCFFSPFNGFGLRVCMNLCSCHMFSCHGAQLNLTPKVSLVFNKQLSVLTYRKHAE